MALLKSDSIQNQNGNLVFTRTDIEISTFFDYLKSGRSLEDFVDDYPQVKLNQLHELLELAEEQLSSIFLS